MIILTISKLRVYIIAEIPDGISCTLPTKEMRKLRLLPIKKWSVRSLIAVTLAMTFMFSGLIPMTLASSNSTVASNNHSARSTSVSTTNQGFIVVKHLATTRCINDVKLQIVKNFHRAEVRNQGNPSALAGLEAPSSRLARQDESNLCGYVTYFPRSSSSLTTSPRSEGPYYPYGVLSTAHACSNGTCHVWKAEFKAQWYYMIVAVFVKWQKWFGWIDCNYNSGVGFSVTVNTCAWHSPNWVNVPGHLVGYYNFKVSFIFDGFPIYADHSMETWMYSSGNWSSHYLN